MTKKQGLSMFRTILYEAPMLQVSYVEHSRISDRGVLLSIASIRLWEDLICNLCWIACRHPIARRQPFVNGHAAGTPHTVR